MGCMGFGEFGRFRFSFSFVRISVCIGITYLSYIVFKFGGFSSIALLEFHLFCICFAGKLSVVLKIPKNSVGLVQRMLPWGICLVMFDYDRA